jgi:hypothetical protein
MMIHQCTTTNPHPTPLGGQTKRKGSPVSTVVLVVLDVVKGPLIHQRPGNDKVRMLHSENSIRMLSLK